jgi:hypothetical protein
MVSYKWALPIVLLFFGSVSAQGPAKTVVVTINYVNDKIVVEPSLSHSHVGDTVAFRTNSGEMILRFVNPFSDDGWVVRSNGGELRFVSQTGGIYRFRCTLQLPDGRLVGWEAGDREYAGGEHNVPPNHP